MTIPVIRGINPLLQQGMARDFHSGHSALRWGRWSSPGAEYFVTICTKDRERGLTSQTAVVVANALKLAAEGAWRLRTLTVMPDHMHLLVALGNVNDLAACVRLFKGRRVPHLRPINVQWQRGYFDHRMRADEDRLSLFLYIFLNPYRAKLLSPSESWSGYYCHPEDWEWFEPLTNSSCPFPAWLL
jgi:putative transposase